MVQTLGKAVPQFLIKLFSSQDPAIAFLGLYPKKFKAYVHTKNLHMHVYSILTHNYQTLEANKWSFRRGMDKQCYIWQRYYSAMKTLKRLVVARDWREREINRQGTKDFQGSETTLDDTRMMCVCVCVCVCTRVHAQLLSCVNSWQPYGLQPVRLLCPWDSPGKNTGSGCHALLQGIFPTQGLNSHLLNLCVGR